jgi:Na+-translocating ferredoxin:NAD+ oxidoreductase RnfD subunit
MTIAAPHIYIRFQTFLKQFDPRITVFSSLLLYLVLGFTLLGFNRSPLQALITTASCGILEVIFSRLFKGKWIFPISAFITSLSLSILLNYSHDYWILLVPVFFAISTKYVFIFNNRHNYNPAQVAVTLSLLFCSELITSAPAYQWYGLASIGILIAFLGLMFVMPQVSRAPLVLSFLTSYTLLTLLRAWIMQHHLPFQTLFLGSITSPAFFLFTFFMITDPATSPNDRKEQIKVGVILAVLDLLFHIKQSYYTFFYAGFTLQSYRLLKNHWKAIREQGSIKSYIVSRAITSGYYKQLLIILAIMFSAIFVYQHWLRPKFAITQLPFKFKLVDAKMSGLDSTLSNALYRTDARLHHIIKWILSVGDSVAVGDIDLDGRPDLFLTNMLKQDHERAALYRNLGDFKFERVSIPFLTEHFTQIEKNGLPSNGVFVDYDNDGDVDLFVMTAFGAPLMLKNLLKESQKLEFVEVSHELGLNHYVNGIAANFADLNRDGRLDLIVAHVWPSHLPDYPKDRDVKLNVFQLPQPEYPGDIRMFNFMHSSWHLSDNGGKNVIYIQNQQGKFERLDSDKIGLPETYWSLAIGTADFDGDGWIDLYIANDFGPDNFYLNQGNLTFKKIEGTFFGDLGLDTYKGMNASVEDIDNNGFPDIYISNVHHEMQAEGSLFWFFGKDQNGKLIFKDRATSSGALNENRFGWGASIVDVNNDGLLDIIQANGMVDDRPDRLYKECRDYWYTNEKIARSAPEIHRYIHYWGDIRGHCIYPNELNRLYLNTGRTDHQMFVDVAEQAGLDQKDNSRGVAAADFNNDGLMDLVITNQFTQPNLLQNSWNAVTQNQWIGFDLSSHHASCNQMALGTLLSLNYFDGTQNKIIRKEIKLANGFSAQNEARVHFGLGQIVQGKITLEVNWCQKFKQTMEFDDWNKYKRIVLDGETQI